MTGTAPRRGGRPIPARLAGAPVSNGLIVPYITLAHRDRTRAVWGQIDPLRYHQALWRRLCQICGQPLEENVTLYIRPIDYQRGIAPEAGLHLECGDYTRQACPMLSGHLQRYNPAPQKNFSRCDDSRCTCTAWIPPAAQPGKAGRAGAPAEAWYEALIDLGDYQVVQDPGNDITPPVTGINLREVHFQHLRRIRAAAPSTDGREPKDILALLMIGRELFGPR